jgi:archaemetzincin
MIVGVVPSGKSGIQENGMNFLEKTMIGVEKSFKKAHVSLSCQLIPPRAVNIPKLAYNENAGKHLTHPFFDLGMDMKNKAEKILTEDIEKVLVLTDVDIYDPPYIELYGQADDSIALVSIFRLKKKATKTKLLERTIKESVHELGHTFGLKHCREKSCVMIESLSEYDIDDKTPFFCRKCSEELKTNGRKSWTSWDWVKE